MTSAKQLKPKFAPGKKARYSDTNYQLLGKIIETVTKKDIHTVFKEFIFDELKLENTYLYEDVNDNRPAPIYYKDKRNLFTQIYVIRRTRRRHCIDSKGIYDISKGIYQWTFLSKRRFR